MKDRIRRAFDDIRADEALLQKTADRLEAARGKGGKKKRPLRPSRLAGALAAVLVLVLGAFLYRTLYTAPAAYVGIDVNPSVELTLNRMDRVLGAVAYNAQGEALLEQLSLKGKRYDQAAADLMQAMEQQGYFGRGALVTLTVQATDGAKEQALCATLWQLADQQLAAAPAPAAVEVFPVSQETRETAHGCHMSAAKYLAIQELMAVDQTATLEGYSDASIQQIRLRTRACQENHGGEGAAGAGSSGGGQGHGQGQGQGQVQGQGQGGHGHGHGHGAGQN